MKRKFKLGTIAISLAAIMFTQSMSIELLSAIAEEIADSLSQEETIEREFYYGNMVDRYNIGNGYIIQENVGNRTETTKEFLMSDDTIMVQQFVEPIHYYENGEYKEIDNSLIEVVEAGKSVYENKSNSFKVKIDKEQTSCIRVEENGVDFSFKYKSGLKKAPKGTIKNSEEIEKKDYNGKEYTRPQSREVPDGKISCNGMEENTDFVYKIQSNKLSNAIVISKQKKSYSYIFEIQSQNLTFEQNVDGSIYASNASGQTEFIMPLPYMVDANGNYSDKVTYALSNANGKTELTLTADAEWTNANATFPVTVMSEIESSKSNKFNFKNVYENGSTIENADKLYIGKKNGSEKRDAYLSFKFPSVKPYYELIGASVKFEYETQGMGVFNGKDLSYDVYVADASNLSAVTYLNKPEKTEDLNAIEKTSQLTSKILTYESDIIDPNKLKTNTLTIGIETAAETSENGYITLSTSGETTSVLYWYKKVIGIEDDYSMETFGINEATAYINNGTGQLTSVFGLASVNTLSDMPFEASLIYNDYYYEVLAEIGKTSIVGNNFKMNFQQFMVAHNNVYELIDADGSISTFHALGSGLYYSKEKKLYYNSSTGIVYDLQGNQMEFTNGRLTKIVSQNNPTEYIKVVYASTASDQITRVEYYANSALKYTMSFTYSGGRLSTVTTNADTLTPLQKSLQYDGEGNLISITNKTNHVTGVKTLSLGYCRRHSNSDPIGMLDYIYDNQKNGIIFDRDHDDTICEVRNMNGKDTMSTSRCLSSVKFLYKGVYTDIYYIENNVMTNMRCVSFNNSKEVISEWEQDSKGLVSIQATTNWKNISATGTEDYVKETCTYYHKSLPTNDKGINENGGKLTYTVSAESLEVQNHQNYSFAIIFKVGTGDMEDELLAGLNLSVKIGNSSAQNIILDYGGSTYIVIPCDYYSSATNVVITNRGTKYVSVQYFTYALVNRAQEFLTYDTEIAAHKLSSAATSLRSGQYNYITYDEKQRISTELTREISTDSVTETTTYSYYDASADSNLAKGKIKEMNTTKANSEEVDKTEYAYTGSWNNYTETVTTTQNSDKIQTVYNLNRASSPYTVTLTDENNIQAKGYYKALSGDIRLWQLEYENKRETYDYNNLGQIVNTKLYEGSNGTPAFSQTNHYDENGVYLGSSYGGTKYTYGYDDTGFVTSIGYGGTGETDSITPLLQYSYYGDGYGLPGAIDSNKLFRKTYANGNVEEYTYTQSTSSGNTVNKELVNHKNTANGSTVGTYVYNYNANGAMTSQSYQTNGYRRLSYDYGDLDNVEKQTLTVSGLEFQFEYTNYYDTLNNRVKKSQIYSMIGCSTANYKTVAYSYDTKGQVSGIGCDFYDVTYAYDKMGRLTDRIAPSHGYYQEPVNEDYVYKTYGNGYTTNLLTLIDDKTDENNDRTATYDENGYVTSVSYNGNRYTYTYDGAGRLSSEKIGNTTKTYTYDSRNNIQKTGLSYTNGKLTAVNGRRIVYDAMGNPTTYKGNTFHWEQGRKLVSGTLNGNSFAYSYDGNGMRYEKEVDGTTTSYYYNGTQLLMESKEGQRAWYIYGVTGIEGMILEENNNESIYYFDKNTLGDVIAIRDETGSIVAEYEYDAWGNVTVTDEYGSEDTDEYFIGNMNPFRYRGYYYDVETGFYYLQTRYYDPSICRFINADDYEIVPYLAEIPGQLNLYAYCNNNPVMYTDESGMILLTTALAIVFAIAGAIGFGYYGYTQVAGDETMSTGQKVATVALYAIGGAVAGGFFGAGLGYAAALFGGTAAGMVGGEAALAMATAISVEEAVALGLAVGVAGVAIGGGDNVNFAKGNGARPGHNQHENKQYKAVMKELGYNRNSPEWEKGHRALMKYKEQGHYIEKYSELRSFIKKALGLI